MEVEHGRRRRAGQRRGVGDGLKVLGLRWCRAVLDLAVQRLLHRC